MTGPDQLNRLMTELSIEDPANDGETLGDFCSVEILDSKHSFKSSGIKAPAVFIGRQPGFGAIADIELFNLVAPVGHHSAGSTVSRQTLEAHGYLAPSMAN